MSKTFIYSLLVIGVFILIVFPKMNKGKTEEEPAETQTESDTKSGSGLSENADENGVSQGASGQQKYRIGWTQ